MKHRAAHAPQILLVDDNATNLQVLYQTLDGHGYRLLAARSGKDALSIAQRAVPDLILLDVMMPEMDGFETCARLKADARTRDAAIIFLSALTDASDKVRGLELGAVDFVNKPFQAEEVLARVRTHLTIRDLQKQLRRATRSWSTSSTSRRSCCARQATAPTASCSATAPSPCAFGRTFKTRRSPTTPCSSAARRAATTKRSPAPCIISRAARSRAIICVNCLAVGSDARPRRGRAATPDFFDKLRLADGGTLYLEGIQHLPRGLAAHARRAPPCASTTRATPADGAMPDVRVIVSTTRDIDEELAAGRLIPELHRALPQTLDIAPLRARLDDLPALAPHILRRQAEQAGRTVPISPKSRCSGSRATDGPATFASCETCSGPRWRPARVRCSRLAITCWTTACGSAATA